MTSQWFCLSGSNWSRCVIQGDNLQLDPEFFRLRQKIRVGLRKALKPQQICQACCQILLVGSVYYKETSLVSSARVPYSLPPIALKQKEPDDKQHWGEGRHL